MGGKSDNELLLSFIIDDRVFHAKGNAVILRREETSLYLELPKELPYLPLARAVLPPRGGLNSSKQAIRIRIKHSSHYPSIS